MQIKLSDMVPKIKKAAEDTEIKMVEVADKKGKADEIAEKVGKEEAIVQEAVDKANAIKEECEGELAKAMPILEKAEAALKTVTQDDLVFMKQMKSPPQAIRDTMQAICLILNPDHKEKMKDPTGMKQIPDWWAASLKMLGDPKLLSTI